MALVPERVFENFLRQQRQETPATLTKLGDLDTKMSSVLEQDDQTEEEKAKLYAQLLERYLRFKDKRALETEVPVKVIHTADNPTTTKQSPEDIAELLPKTLRPKAKMVLKRIEENPDIINWNDKGELQYNGVIMPDTNIADLVATSVRKRKKTTNTPEGYDTFLKALKRIRVPTNIISAGDRVKNESLKKDSAQVGVSSPKKRKSSKKNERWLSVHEKK